MAVGEGGDRGAVREIVRLEQLRRAREDCGTEAAEGGESHEDVDAPDPLQGPDRLHGAIEPPCGEAALSGS
jgi:hypothetical protein